MKKTILPTLLILFLANENIDCKKYEKRAGSIAKGGIMLSFDDNRINNWYKNLNLLDSLQLKATFYLSSYNKLNAAQKEKLHAIENRGHEIGYHTLNHPNMVEYPSKFK